MKIIQIISSLASGGAERFVANISNQLCDEGHDVIVCTMNDNPDINFNKQFLDPRIKYHSFQIKGKNFLWIIKRVYQFIQLCKPDIIHCHLATIQYLLPIYLEKKSKVFHTIHSMPKYASGGGGWHKILFKVLYKTGCVIPITIAAECHNSYKNFYGLNNDFLIENGVPSIKSTANIDSIKKEVESYKQSKRTPVFIHVARFHPSKNQRMLIEVFNELTNLDVDYTLLVLGRGFNEGDGKKIKESASQNIHFLGEKSNVGDYLLCSDFFCLTSIYEGLPISLIEAMSVGLTPISTAVGGTIDVIQNGITGYLCKEITKESYIETVLYAIENKLDSESIIKYFEQNFSMVKCTYRYLELFNKKH